MEETTGTSQEKTGAKKVIGFKNAIIAAGSRVKRRGRSGSHAGPVPADCR